MSRKKNQIDLILCAWVVMTMMIRIISADLLYTKQPKVVTTKGRSVTFSFFENITSPDTVTSVFVTLPPSTEQIVVGVGNGFSYSNKNNQTKPFFDRLNVGYKASDKSYNFRIQNLRYSDSLMFQVTAIYWENNNINKTKTVQAKFELIVEGGPNLCGKTLPAVIGINTSMSLTTGIHLCGNQKPLIIWTFDGQALNTSNTTNTIERYKYLYQVTLPDITSAMCGKGLSYNATGHGLDIIGKTIVIVNFTPQNVIIKQSYRYLTHVYVSWDTLNTGNCNALIYEIKFINASNYVISKVTANQSMSEITYLTSINITLTMMRAIYKGNYGKWSSKTVSHAPRTTTTTTVKSTSIPKTGSSSSNDDDIGLIVGCSVGGLVLLILIVLLIFCCCCKKKSEKENKTVSSIHEYDQQKDIQHASVEKSHNNSQNGIENKGLDKPDLISAPPLAQKDNDDSETEESEFVNMAKVKYYNPEEFGIEIPAQKVELKTNSKENDGNIHAGYHKDEFESDSDASYENYKPEKV